MVGQAQKKQGFWIWESHEVGISACFVGKSTSPRQDSGHEFTDIIPESSRIAWLQQIHSAKVIEACAGQNGDGDALVTSRHDLALKVVTADCVPILLGSPQSLAAIHAGWRGLASKIISESLKRIAAPAETITAWIGPAIGPCCYEVGEDVAAAVVRASSVTVRRPGLSDRPHLDLAAAAQQQLEAGGVHKIHRVSSCTHCESERLWSYRREGPGAGRNVALIWRTLDGN